MCAVGEGDGDTDGGEEEGRGTYARTTAWRGCLTLRVSSGSSFCLAEGAGAEEEDGAGPLEGALMGKGGGSKFCFLEDFFRFFGWLCSASLVNYWGRRQLLSHVVGVQASMDGGGPR